MSQGWSFASEFAVSILRCPICEERFGLRERSLVCEKGHSFDIARAGYVNLLKKASGLGDSGPMLRHRKRFHDSGAYDLLRSRVTELALEALKSQTTEDQIEGERAVLDLGCGDGYFLRGIESGIEYSLSSLPKDPRTATIGIDISRDAAKITARAAPGSVVLVADSHALPLANGSVAVALVIFAPRGPSEISRVLISGGVALVAIPRPGHLAELRPLLAEGGFRFLSTEKNKEADLIESFAAERLALAHAEEVVIPLRLGADEALDLILMTPSARHIEDIDTLARFLLESSVKEPIAVTGTFRVLAFRAGSHGDRQLD